VVGQWKEAGKDCKIGGFSDPIISRGRVIIDLIDAIQPGSVKYNVVKAADNDEVRLNYIYSVAVDCQRVVTEINNLHQCTA